MSPSTVHLVLLLGLQACALPGGDIKDDLGGPSDPSGGETGPDDPEDETGGASTDSALDSGAPEDSAETGDSATEDTGEPDDDEPTDPPAGHVCWTLYEDVSMDQFWAGHLDPATGHVTPVVELFPEDEGLLSGLSSLGREGDLLYSCEADNSLVTFSILDGTVTDTFTPCISAARWRGESTLSGGLVLLTFMSESIELYPELGAALDGATGDVLLGDDAVYASRITVSDDLLYAAWHSTDTIDVVDLATGEVLPSIVTEDREDWVWGMAILEEALLVMDHDTLSSFNRATGEAYGTVDLEAGPHSYRFSGLLCESAEELEEF